MLGAARLSPQTPPPPPLPGALRGLYTWLDGLPLSRPKRHLARDFSDGVMLAEIVKHFHPGLVDLHNYVPTCNTDRKLSNWSVLNRKVFQKLRFCVSEADIRKVVASTPGAIEPILCALREKVMDPSAVPEEPWDPASGPWEHPDPGVRQLLKEKEQALAILQETVKILQMKVARLEHLVRLKDQRIAELTRRGDVPMREAAEKGSSEGGHPAQVS